MDPVYLVLGANIEVHKHTSLKTHPTLLINRCIQKTCTHYRTTTHKPSRINVISFPPICQTSQLSSMHTHTINLYKLHIIQWVDQVRITVDDVQVFSPINPPISAGLRVSSGRETHIAVWSGVSNIPNNTRLWLRFSPWPPIFSRLKSCHWCSIGEGTPSGNAISCDSKAHPSTFVVD